MAAAAGLRHCYCRVHVWCRVVSRLSLRSGLAQGTKRVTCERVPYHVPCTCGTAARVPRPRRRPQHGTEPRRRAGTSLSLSARSPALCCRTGPRSPLPSPLSSHCPATQRRRPSWAVSRFSSRARVTLPPPLSLSLPLYSRVCISFSVAIAKPEPTAVRSEALPCQLATWPVGDGQALASTRPVASATDAVKGLGS